MDNDLGHIPQDLPSNGQFPRLAFDPLISTITHNAYTKPRSLLCCAHALGPATATSAYCGRVRSRTWAGFVKAASRLRFPGPLEELQRQITLWMDPNRIFGSRCSHEMLDHAPTLPEIPWFRCCFAFTAPLLSGFWARPAQDTLRLPRKLSDPRQRSILSHAGRQGLGVSKEADIGLFGRHKTTTLATQRRIVLNDFWALASETPLTLDPSTDTNTPDSQSRTRAQADHTLRHTPSHLHRRNALQTT